MLTIPHSALLPQSRLSLTSLPGTAFGRRTSKQRFKLLCHLTTQQIWWCWNCLWWIRLLCGASAEDQAQTAGVMKQDHLASVIKNCVPFEKELWGNTEL